MLCLGRKAGQKIILRHDDWPSDIEILVMSVENRGTLVRLGMNVDRSVTILREEIAGIGSYTANKKAKQEERRRTAALRSQFEALPESGPAKSQGAVEER